jgi:hypothetical protein
VAEFHEGPGRDRAALVDTLEKAGFAVELWENVVHRDLGYLRAIRRELVV